MCYRSLIATRCRWFAAGALALMLCAGFSSVALAAD
jgi:hypothetical protein